MTAIHTDDDDDDDDQLEQVVAASQAYLDLVNGMGMGPILSVFSNAFHFVKVLPYIYRLVFFVFNHISPHSHSIICAWYAYKQ